MTDTAAPCCGDRKMTILGFEAWCSFPPGHPMPHESADYYWFPEMLRAQHKEANTTEESQWPA